MPQTVEFDLKQTVLRNDTFGPREVRQMQEAIGRDFSQYAVLRDAVGELQSHEDHTPASRVRLGVCLYLLGRYYRAIEMLKQADGGAMAHYYLAKCHFARQEYAEAIESYKAAEKSGYDAGDWRWAAPRLSATAAIPEPRWPCLIRCAERSNRLPNTFRSAPPRWPPWAAIPTRWWRSTSGQSRLTAAIQAPCSAWPWRTTATATMRRQWSLYKRAVSRFPAHIGSLVNLGLLHEDRDQFDKAAQCYQRILDVYPDHARAMLYFKDTEASHEQYYDEDAQKKRDRMGQVLNIPVTDFELSVRSRNCLQKMGIMTLGDLCRCTEQELLASKNFGETSLVEIKEMLATKGLRLGQYAQERQTAEIFEPEPLTADEQAMLARPISELNLSVRARKCMIRLGINTLADLIRRTGDDLLECKNFGVTSLNEVREKLTAIGLKLRGE